MVLTGLKCSERAGIIVYLVGCNFVAVNNVALLLSDTTKLALALASDELNFSSIMLNAQ